MRRIAGVLITLLAVCASCTIVDFIAGDPYDFQDQYQSQFTYPAALMGTGNPWIGQHTDALTTTLGQPDTILEARPKNAPWPDGIHILSYVYYGDRSSSGACIDTYVVVEASGMIIKYYCR